jgi:hypothetical protein
LSRRIFVNVSRGMTDKTAICVYPWEVDVLALVHGQAIEEVSIEQMCDMKGPLKVEKLKLKHTEHPAPDLRSQLEIMAYVDPEEDPANDPAGEYERLAMKYGMDKELPIACVTRVYGEFSSGAFEARLQKYAKDRQPKPAALKAADEGLNKQPIDMTVGELREALKERGIKWKVTEGQAVLAARSSRKTSPRRDKWRASTRRSGSCARTCGRCWVLLRPVLLPVRIRPSSTRTCATPRRSCTGPTTGRTCATTTTTSSACTRRCSTIRPTRTRTASRR